LRISWTGFWRSRGRGNSVISESDRSFALGDEIGAAFGAQLILVLIGERPGLSSPDSPGAYLTYALVGLGYEAAARRIDWIAAAGVARGG
jgi:ethanolamine ammonia-lyase small subunit